MADFSVFFPTLLKHEGGFVDNPNDPGGATNKGITLKTFEGCAQKYLGIEPTLDNLKALTDAQAEIIYKNLYWDRVWGDQFITQELANIVFDFFVNAGANATKLLQREVNKMGSDIAVDGGMGNNTMNATNEKDQPELYNNYKQGRIQYYKDLVEKNPKLEVFLKGWLNRVNSFPDM